MLRAQPVDAFSSLYETSKFSDLTVELKDGQILMLHKALVCRLDFFRAACDGSFRVSSSVTAGHLFSFSHSDVK